MRTVRGLLVFLILTAAPGVSRAAGVPSAWAGDGSAPATGATPAAEVGADSAQAVTPSPALPDSGRVVTDRPAADSQRSVTGSAPADSGRWVQRGSGASDSSRSVRPAPTRPWLRRPRQIMLRSVVVPGWGQWANGRHVKAAVVAVGEGYLLVRAVDYGRQERAKWREAGAATDPVEKGKLERRHLALGSHRRDFTWWSVFAGLLSMGDAYVDAQLGNFDAEFEPQGTGALGGPDSGWRASVALRW